MRLQRSYNLHRTERSFEEKSDKHQRAGIQLSSAPAIKKPQAVERGTYNFLVALGVIVEEEARMKKGLILVHSKVKRPSCSVVHEEH